MRLGILTGGGDAPGLNAVIRAATRVAIRKLKWEVCGVEDGFEGLFDDNMVKPLTLPMVRGLLSRGGTILGTTNRGRLVTKGQLVQEQVAAAAERIKKLEDMLAFDKHAWQFHEPSYAALCLSEQQISFGKFCEYMRHLRDGQKDAIIQGVTPGAGGAA